LRSEQLSQPRYFDAAGYNNPIQPIAGVAWYEAAAYCWLTELGHNQGWLPTCDSIRLPTWLEWERAARYTDRRRYPWGDDTPHSERANYNATGLSGSSPVGCFPAGVAECRALDLAGNVLEWTATPSEQPEHAVAQEDFTPSSEVVISSGCYALEVENLCCGAPNRYVPNYWNVNLGFRVILSRALDG
jgi:formylglycine-generating enzyme required for sulfatase activity